MRPFWVKFNRINDLAPVAQARVQRAEKPDFLRVAANFTAFSAVFSTLSV
jgi:hypothetical protein